MRKSSLLLYLLIGILCVDLNSCGQERTGQETMSQEDTGRTSPAPTTVVRSENAPIRLRIPTIDVDATIVPVGVASGGDLAVPAQHPWTDVGWYSAGAVPGERGSAVIDGHLDRPGGFPAAFWNLRLIRPGDEVFVMLLHAKFLRFHVTRPALYTPQTAPLQAIFGDAGGSYLNLITCAGDWVPSQHQTTLRMVVYTALG